MTWSEKGSQQYPWYPISWLTLATVASLALLFSAKSVIESPITLAGETKHNQQPSSPLGLKNGVLLSVLLNIPFYL